MGSGWWWWGGIKHHNREGRFGERFRDTGFRIISQSTGVKITSRNNEDIISVGSVFILNRFLIYDS